MTSINRKAAEQVAWAYLSLRMSYSYDDRGPDQHSQQAATFAGGARQPSPSSTAAGAAAGWGVVVQNRMRATVTVTDMDVYAPGRTSSSATRQALIRVTWTRTLSSELNAPVRTSGSTTVTLEQQRDDTWLVTDDGFADPN